MGGVSPPPCHTPGWAGQSQSQLEPRMEAGGLPWREDEGRQPNSQALPTTGGQHPAPDSAEQLPSTHLVPYPHPTP